MTRRSSVPATVISAGSLLAIRNAAAGGGGEHGAPFPGQERQRELVADVVPIGTRAEHRPQHAVYLPNGAIHDEAVLVGVGDG